jgi:uroporphyrinogen III methyltransferase / synthase
MLTGKRVLLTRPKGQSAELARLLRARGARVVALPAIRIRPPADSRPLREAARRYRLGEYDRVVFTSPNGVKRFFAELSKLGRKSPRPSSAFAAIGPKTAEALSEAGIRAASWPEEHRAEALAASMRVKRGERVLLPRAAKARDVLPDRLRKRGAIVEIVEAYRTEPEPGAARRLRNFLLGDAPPDWITFTSSSTAESLRGLFTPREWRRVFLASKAASIGPITSATLRRLGVRPAAEGRPYTAAGLAKAIEAAA